jgi:hypothetical protein
MRQQVGQDLERFAPQPADAPGMAQDMALHVEGTLTEDVDHVGILHLLKIPCTFPAMWLYIPVCFLHGLPVRPLPRGTDRPPGSVQLGRLMTYRVDLLPPRREAPCMFPGWIIFFLAATADHSVRAFTEENQAVKIAAKFFALGMSQVDSSGNL